MNSKKAKKDGLDAAKWSEQQSLRNLFCTWAFSNADRDGPWAWRNIAQEDLRTVIKKLSDFETMPRDKIGGSHFINTGHFLGNKGASPKAQERLKEIKNSDQLNHLDGFFSFRITGKKRLWCLQETGFAKGQIIYKILWWDPEHKVWPTKQTRT